MPLNVFLTQKKSVDIFYLNSWIHFNLRFNFLQNNIRIVKNRLLENVHHFINHCILKTTETFIEIKCIAYEFHNNSLFYQHLYNQFLKG